MLVFPKTRAIDLGPALRFLYDVIGHPTQDYCKTKLK